MNQELLRALRSASELAKSITIKHTPSVDAMSREHKEKPGSDYDIDHPADWKFYRNIQGEYHSLDNAIYVQSMDTQERIEFTKENLKEHKATKVSYSVGTSYYYDLVRRHPSMEIYIKGVLSPIDWKTAHDAAEGSILSYSGHLIAANEITLIRDIEQWIQRFIGRWENPDLNLIYDHYAAGCIVNLYSKLPFVIFYLRLLRLNTYEVSEFDLEQTFASNLRLDRFTRFLSQEQRLYLYNNLDRLKSGIGTTAVFEELMLTLMERRGLPAATYRMLTDDSNIIDKGRPTLAAKEKINFRTLIDEEQYIDIEQLFNKENVSADGNQASKPKWLAHTDEAILRNRLKNYPTKVIETQADDIANLSDNTLASVVMNQWKYLADNGLYRSVFSIINPINNEAVNFTTEEAFILYVYVASRLVGLDNFKLTAGFAQGVLRINKPTVQELRSFSSGNFDFTPYFEKIVEEFPVTPTMINAYDFFDFCNRVLVFDRMCDVLKDNIEHYEARGEFESILTRLWVDKRIDYAVDDFPTWLEDRNFDIRKLDENALIYFHTRLYEQCTGHVADSENNVTAIQNALIGIMEEFSSYSIQYIKSSAGKDITLATQVTPRIGNTFTAVRSLSEAEMVYLEAIVEHNPIVNNTSVDLADIVSTQDMRIVSDLSRAVMDVYVENQGGDVLYESRVELAPLEILE